MRKLAKSAHGIGQFDFNTRIRAHTHNLSPKPLHRLMQALDGFIHGQPDTRLPWVSNALHNLPNRAERRALFQVKAQTANRAGRRLIRFFDPARQAVVDACTPPERKLTGAVRRGLERGRVA